MTIKMTFAHQLYARCDNCGVRQDGICSSFSGELLEKFSGMARKRLVPQGCTIFRDGDEVTSFASILSGVVKLSKTTASGEFHIITLMYPPDFLGYTFEDEHRCSAAAATDVELCTYPRRGFFRLLQESAELNRRIFELTTRELEFTREWMLMLRCKASYQRVAGLFAVLAKRSGLSGAGTPTPNHAQFILPLSRFELADYLGLTLETVSRNISQLKRNGLIELLTVREVIVPDVGRLLAEADMRG